MSLVLILLTAVVDKPIRFWSSFFSRMLKYTYSDSCFWIKDVHILKKIFQAENLKIRNDFVVFIVLQSYNLDTLNLRVYILGMLQEHCNQLPKIVDFPKIILHSFIQLYNHGSITQYNGYWVRSGWVSLFNGISIFMGYLMQKPCRRTVVVLFNS